MRVAAANSAPRGLVTFVLLALLALQLALQPFLARKFTSPEACKTSIVMTCELCKIVIAALCLVAAGTARPVLRAWSFKESLVASGLPGAIYALQNVCLQFAYARLSPTVFQLLNQTKVFWSVLFCFFLLGQRQTKVQCVALVMLAGGAFVATSGKAGGEMTFLLGALPGLLAAVLSGLASALSQWTLQGRKRNVFLFGGEMAVVTVVSLSINAAVVRQPPLSTLFAGWTTATLVPVLSGAVGGLLVGLVTARAGNVAKGYAIVSGIVMTGFLEAFAGAPGLRPAGWLQSGHPASVSWRLWLALLLVAGSTAVRATIS